MFSLLYFNYEVFKIYFFIKDGIFCTDKYWDSSLNIDNLEYFNLAHYSNIYDMCDYNIVVDSNMK